MKTQIVALFLAVVGINAAPNFAAATSSGKNQPSTSATQVPAAAAAPAGGGVAVAPSNAAAERVVEGEIAKIVARKKEIYVQAPDKKHEFYFKPNTQLLKDGQPVDFATLTEGLKVRVTYVLVGRRMDPVKVEVLQ